MISDNNNFISLLYQESDSDKSKTCLLTSAIVEHFNEHEKKEEGLVLPQALADFNHTDLQKVKLPIGVRVRLPHQLKDHFMLMGTDMDSGKYGPRYCNSG